MADDPVLKDDLKKVDPVLDNPQVLTDLPMNSSQEKKEGKPAEKPADELVNNLLNEQFIVTGGADVKNPDSFTNKKKSKVPAIIVVVMGFLLLAAPLGVYFYSANTKTQEPVSQAATGSYNDPTAGQVICKDPSAQSPNTNPGICGNTGGGNVGQICNCGIDNTGPYPVCKACPGGGSIGSCTQRDACAPVVGDRDGKNISGKTCDELPPQSGGEPDYGTFVGCGGPNASYNCFCKDGQFACHPDRGCDSCANKVGGQCITEKPEPTYKEPTFKITPQITTIQGRCVNIKIYKDNQIVDGSTLKPGDQVQIAVVGQNATMARIRFQPANQWIVNPSLPGQQPIKNGQGEFIFNWTVPTGQTIFTIEAEVFTNGQWK